MDPRAFKDAVFEQFSRAAAAFASPKRVEIIDLLTQAERTVESIATATAMTVGNTSHHLQILRGAGMVEARRKGLHVVYRIADPSVVAGYLHLRSLAEERMAEVSRLASSFFDEHDGATAVSFDDLKSRLGEGETLLIDVRPSLEYDAGHLPGAVNIPLEELSARMAEVPVDASVVAYCRGPYCVLSALAVERLRATGHEASRLEGGPFEWAAHDLTLTQF
ncbi:MAG: ArsR family transcriptional regulator [Demequinaceae bacterium]|nr:ArsR family transcriptional regulator [Demequinaceae bacterium]